MTNKKNNKKNTKNTTNKKNTKKNSKNASKLVKFSKKKQKDKKKEKEKNEVAKIEVPKTRHIIPPQYCMCKVGTEIYITDEENYEPYVSPYNQAAAGATVDEDEEEEEDTEDTEEEEETDEEEEEPAEDEEEEEDNPGYDLHMGEIIGTHYVNQISNMGFESDYKEMTSAGSLKLDEVDLTKSYKGVRLQLLSEWEKPAKNIKWEDLTQGVLGFITEQTFSDNTVEIKVSGMTKTMEKKVKFDFKQMKRSEILREIILTAGLKPMINVEGLDDDVIDFTNISSSGGSDDTGDMSSTGSATIDEAVKNAIKGKSGCLDKAKAIDKAFKDHIVYDYYYDVHHPDLDEAWKSNNLNCADGANVLSAMFRSAGIDATILHTTNHYIVRVTCNGTNYYTDNAANSGSHTTRPFGEVYGDDPSSGSEIGAKIDG